MLNHKLLLPEGILDLEPDAPLQAADDIHERKFWTHYMKAYEDCLNATCTHHAPWYVVPANDKENARLVVS